MTEAEIQAQQNELELRQINKLLSAIDVPPGPTVDRVSTLVGRVVQARDSILRVAAALEGRKV